MVEQIFTFSWELTNPNLDTKQPSFCRQNKHFAASLLNNSERNAVIFNPNEDVPDVLTFYFRRCCDRNCKSIRLRTTFRLFADGGETVNKTTIIENVVKSFKGGFLILQLPTCDVDNINHDNLTLKINYVPLMSNKEITRMRVQARTLYNGRWIEKYRRVWSLINFSEARQGKVLQQSLYITEGGFLLFDVCIFIEKVESGEVLIIQFIRHSDIPWKPLSVNALITVLDAHGIDSDIWKQGQHVFHFRTSKEVWQFPIYITKASLLRQKNKYLSNDALKLKFEFTVHLGTLSSIPKILNTFSVEFIDRTYLDTFTENMKDLYNTKRFADVLLSLSGETMPANKIVLQCRSTKFAEMLDDMNGTYVLDIHDVTMISLKRMLKFMYTDELDNLRYDEAIVDYVAASKFNIESLKCKYSCALQSLLSVSNVCHNLMLADDLGDEHLKNCAMDFIEQYWESVNVSKEWESLSKERQSLAQRTKAILNLK